MRKSLLNLFKIAFVAVATFGAATVSSQDNSTISAFQEPQDSAEAINDPDRYAWQLFVALNWPAASQPGMPDTTRKLGANGPTVWETWRNAKDVFPAGGADPGPWPTASPTQQRSLDEFDAQPLQQLLRNAKLGVHKILIDPGAALNQRNETRMNRPAFEFIRANGLYDLNRQVALFDQGKQTISFPLAAKEIKAQWRIITEADKPRYHWAVVTRPDGAKVLFGLTALHITSKDLPNWFWATFEHIDNKTRPGNEPWALPSRDTLACESAKPDCELAPKGLGLEGTPWEYYRLRGTQVDFTTSRGETTLLANSQPERGFQRTSSCITCHSRSSVGANGARLDVFKPDGTGFVGPIDPAWYGGTGKPSKFTQLDFVWAMFRASPGAK